AKLAVRTRHVKSPVELLTNHVNQNRVLGRWKFIHPLRPKWNREPDEQNSLNQHDRKFEVRGNSAANTRMIGFRVAAPAKADQNKNKKGRPSDKKRTHKTVREFDDVIDLVAVLGGVRRRVEKFVNEREATPTSPNLRLRVPDVAQAASGHAAKS